MPVRLIFRCEFCDAVPDRDTQRTLESQLRELVFGEYLDAPPARWLAWQGGGPRGLSAMWKWSRPPLPGP